MAAPLHELEDLGPPQRQDPGLATWSFALELLEHGSGRRAPYPQYANDPVGFFRNVLGVEPWGRHPGLPADEASQIDILEAVRDHDRVAVRSGHKVSKSCSAAPKWPRALSCPIQMASSCSTHSRALRNWWSSYLQNWESTPRAKKG